MTNAEKQQAVKGLKEMGCPQDMIDAWLAEPEPEQNPNPLSGPSYKEMIVGRKGEN